MARNDTARLHWKNGRPIITLHQRLTMKNDHLSDNHGKAHVRQKCSIPCNEIAVWTAPVLDPTRRLGRRSSVFAKDSHPLEPRGQARFPVTLTRSARYWVLCESARLPCRHLTEFCANKQRHREARIVSILSLDLKLWCNSSTETPGCVFGRDEQRDGKRVSPTLG